MLKQLKINNFLSFAEPTTFDFSTTRYGILSTTNVSSTNVLKGNLFIGPNASGKTNALKAIAFLLHLFRDEKTYFSRYACLWGKHNTYELVYTFEFEKSVVEYSLKYHINTRSLEEKLLIDEQEVLNRLGSTGKLSIGDKEIINDNLNSSTIFLRTAAFATGNFPDNPIMCRLIEFIENSTYISIPTNSLKTVKDVTDYAETNGLDKANEYLQEFGYDFTLEYSNESSGEGIKFSSPDKKTVFCKRNSFPVPILYYMESQGNLTFTSILTQIIDVIEKPGMIIIDEFGNSLHNELAERTIRFFMKKADCSQIFITSHCTNLISNSVFRPDQINLITFEGKSGSKQKRLSDYKPREAQNLEKMYLGGMFEGLPRYE